MTSTAPTRRDALTGGGIIALLVAFFLVVMRPVVASTVTGETYGQIEDLGGWINIAAGIIAAGGVVSLIGAIMARN